MLDNVRLLSEELKHLGYAPRQFSTPMRHCPGEGIKFEYQITDGSRTGETVLLGLVIPDAAGTWPEGTPHWVHISPPDSVLEEQVQAVRGNGHCGCVERYEDADGVSWSAISAPVTDFWDQIDTPNGKTAKTYLERHIRRIWAAR